MKAQRAIRGTSLSIHNIGSRWGWVLHWGNLIFSCKLPAHTYSPIFFLTNSLTNIPVSGISAVYFLQALCLNIMCIFILFLILTNFYTPANKHALPFLSYVAYYIYIYNLFPTKIHISRTNNLLIWKFRDRRTGI